MHSCLYQGTVWHRRRRPVKHQFRYSVSMLYLDLDEFDDLARRGYFATVPRWSGASVCAADYSLQSAVTQPHAENSATVNLGRSWRSAVEQFVVHQVGERPAGPIRLLCQPRYFGYLFSPLNLYYCFDAADERVQWIVAEVNNIPWRERHWYLLEPGQGGRTHGRYEHAKEFHVSPFMPMQQRYAWRLGQPSAQLKVGIESRDEATASCGQLFSAVLNLRRGELTRHWQAGIVARHGWASAQVVAAIYWQALQLWWKGCPVYSHSESPPVPSEMRSPSTSGHPLANSLRVPVGPL
jgi:DUF1365 family protein